MITSRLVRLRFVVVLAAASALGAVRASADDAPTPGAQTLAQALLVDAKKLMAGSRFADACPKLAESDRLDPDGDTRLLLAGCYESAGLTASAWTLFNKIVSASQRDKRTDRERVATARVAALAPKLSRLTITVAPAVAALPGLTISLDGTAFNAAAYGVALPVDPGARTVLATAPGHLPWTQTIEVGADADAKTVEVPLLAAAPTASASPAASSPPSASSAVPAASSSAPIAARPPRVVDNGSKRTASYVIGGLGVVALGLSGGLALSAKSKFDDSRARCPTDTCTDPRGVTENQAALSRGNLATVVLAAGVLGVGLGGILYATSSPVKPAVGLGFGAPGALAGATIGGAF